MKTVHLLIHPRPERVAAVRAHVASLHGAKVHAITPEGRVFVTLEREDERELAQELERLGDSPDVVEMMEVSDTPAPGSSTG